MSERQKGGEFFTPTSIVKLIVEVIEPYHGRIFDPACGSEACSSRARVSWKTTRKIPMLRSAYMDRKRPLKLCVGKFDFVMANSASDARGSEQDIRKSLIEEGAVDVMVAVGSNFFYTVTLPCTLWFLDRGKAKTPRKDKVLFPDGKYVDVAGMCRVAALSEIEAQGWSLNPGRYVGVAEREADDFDFRECLEELNEELETLNAEARELEGRIAENVETLLEAG